MAICTSARPRPSSSTGLSQKYNGLFNLRYDDTNPVKEDTEYVDSIWEDIKWLTGEEPSGGVILRLGLL